MLQKVLASFSALSQLFFPHTCAGCGSDIVSSDNFLCLDCLNNLPHTHFANHAGNPAEKKFFGRIPVESGMSEFYFSKKSIIQNIIFEFKYRGNQKLGHYLGNIIGTSLLESKRFTIDLILPIPLFAKKELQRGFNQSAILCEGIAEILQLPIVRNNLIRRIPTSTQTKKHRVQRWENVKDTFCVQEPQQIEGKHVLLVDDVITTGATLESCGIEILKIQNSRLSFASLALASS